MGWASGSSLLADVWDKVRAHIPKDKRKDVLRRLMEAFEDYDCDTVSEIINAEWPEAEEAYLELHPEE